MSVSIVGRATFAQTRIWFDEQTHYASSVLINSMPFFYQITHGSLSIERLRHALRLVLLKHSSLRTSLFFDSTVDCLMQRIIQPKDDDEELFAFVESTLENDADLKTMMINKLCNASNFDLSSARVLLVHAFMQEKNRKNLLQRGDVIVFNFHQTVFDISSLNIFCRDLCQAYECETGWSSDDNELRYIDCKLDNTYLFSSCAYFFLISRYYRTKYLHENSECLLA